MTVELPSFVAGGLAVLAFVCVASAVIVARGLHHAAAWKRAIEERLDQLALRLVASDRPGAAARSHEDASARRAPEPTAETPASLPATPAMALISISRVSSTRSLRLDTPHLPSPGDARFESIRAQARAGRPIFEIARESGVPVGVVELVVRLQNQKQHSSSDA